MRSRFSAFVTGDEDYLLRTWDPETRPERLDLAETGIRFYRLDIIDTVAGGPLDLSLIHISEPTRLRQLARMPSSA